MRLSARGSAIHLRAALGTEYDYVPKRIRVS
jgi:hypothetical protein